MYEVVERSELVSLEKAVNLRLAKGYKLVGGLVVCVTGRGFGLEYMQAMVKPSNGEDDGKE